MRDSVSIAAIAVLILLPASVSAEETSVVRPTWGTGSTAAPRALPVDAQAAAAIAPKERIPKAIPATFGWGPALQMKNRPAETTQSKGPGDWASAYKLGPGDVLNIALQGSMKTRKNGIEIGPDGTLSFLQARRVQAKGKSIPQLRAAIEAALIEHHESPTILVTPVALKSKRYTILGKVRKSGSYPLTRPTTLLEAIAQSGGFVVGASRLSVSELADLRRSFVVRAGQKIGLDFEMLYAQGDLTQNVFLEPNDYVYIASNVDQECYVLGSVAKPGEVPLDSPLTVTGAVAAAGGFGEKAWKARVLLVRGNLSDPTTEVVNMRDILAGKGSDVAIRPGDIVYISNRPWALAEDLLDAAIRSFIQGSAAAAFDTRSSISVGR